MRFKPALNIIFGITTEILFSLFIILTAFLFSLAIYFGIGKYKILSYTAGAGLEGVQAPLPRGDSNRAKGEGAPEGREPLWTRKFAVGFVTKKSFAVGKFSCKS